MKYITCLLVFFSFIITGYSQQTSHWIFGEGAGLKFDLNTETPLEILESSINTREGCASISNDFGDLLFYTDGVHVWDRAHNVMPSLVNGQLLFGSSSSTQSSIIIPKPGDASIYYIFTVDANETGTTNRGFRYSIVDMTLNNGFGDIAAVKNELLLEDCSEKLTATLKNCEDGSVWLITYSSINGQTHNGDPLFSTFYAYEITNQGLNTTPVTSTLDALILDSRGYLKASPDGTKIASANMTNGLYLYDFNKETGEVFNELEINLITDHNVPYGVEFSPNNKYLYVNSSNNSTTADSSFSALTQIDLETIETNNDLAQTIIDERQLYRGALQLGPDGKIYRALSSDYDSGQNYLGVIHNPNYFGDNANYEHNAIDLGTGLSSQGLPPFIQSLFYTEVDIIPNNSNSQNDLLILCQNDTYTLEAPYFENATYNWSFNNNAISNETNTLQIGNDINNAGTYVVSINQNNSCELLNGYAEVIFNQLPQANNITFSNCDNDSMDDGLTTFNLEEALPLVNSSTNVSINLYHTIDDAENEQNNITDYVYTNTQIDEVIFARVTNNDTSCYNISEIILQTSNTTIADVYLETICTDLINVNYNLNDATNDINIQFNTQNNYSYYPTYNDALLGLNELTNTLNVANGTLIYAKLLDLNNVCQSIFKVYFTISNAPILQDDSLHICSNNIDGVALTVDQEIDVNNYTFLWSTGETNANVVVNNAGLYSVLITNQYGCSTTKQFNVETASVPNINTVIIQNAAVNNSVTINTTETGNYLYVLLNLDGSIAYPYQATNVFYNVTPGDYIAKAVSIYGCGESEYQITIEAIIDFPVFFTPNNDGYNDFWTVKGSHNVAGLNLEIQIFNRYGKLLYLFNPNQNNGWDGTLSGNKLPQDDYWYVVKFEDNSLRKGHFTLRR